MTLVSKVQAYKKRPDTLAACFLLVLQGNVCLYKEPPYISSEERLQVKEVKDMKKNLQTGNMPNTDPHGWPGNKTALHIAWEALLGYITTWRTALWWDHVQEGEIAW